MSAIPVLNADGAVSGDATLSGRIAEQEIKPHLIHETVVAELGARRAGTHSTKNRGEVRGGGAKPWRQKGTGRARQGSIRAPHWRGGGVTFGPTPRSHGGKVNRKVRAQAFRSALRAHADRGSLAVMDPAGWDEPSTKRAKNFLYQAPEGLEARPLLVVVDDPDGVEGLSFRNLEDVYVLAAVDVEVVDIMAGRSILLERAVWERFAGAELDVSEVTPTLKDLPAVTPPPKPKPIKRSKPADAKPKRARKGAADPEAEVEEAAADEVEAVVDAPVEGKPKSTARAKQTPADEAPAAAAELTEPENSEAPEEQETDSAAADEVEPVASADEPDAQPKPKPSRAKKTDVDAETEEETS